MSSAEMAVKVFRTLENEDLRVLQIVETAMSEHEFVPKEQVAKFSKLSLERDVDFRITLLASLASSTKCEAPTSVTHLTTLGMIA